MKKLLRVVLLFFGSSVVHGVCPQPAPKVCSAFFRSDAVFIGTVVSEHAVPDRGDPGFVEGWLYRVRVDRRFRGTTDKTAVVHTGNDSGRLLIDVDSGAVLSDLSWIDPTDIEVVKGQCAQAQFIAR
jgi:hypothetical protein